MRYAVIREKDKGAWFVVDLPRKFVHKNGLVVASCSTEQLASQVCDAMEDRFGYGEDDAKVDGGTP